MQQLLNTDVAELLREMQLDYTTWWPASSMTQHSRSGASNSSNAPLSRIVLLVLPRSILTLTADIDRLHGRFSLWGGKLRVQGVNQPQLRRCTQCDELGHESAKCNKYAGLALRLLFKQPLPFAAMRNIQQTSQAKLAFLGSAIEEMQPSRRLTLLFDAQQSDEVKMEEILSRLAPIVSDLASELHQAPDVVNVQHRLRECRECGWMPQIGQSASTHVCPFSMQHGPLPLQRSQRTGATSFAAAAQQSSSRDRSTAAGAASTSSDRDRGMCMSWRRYKSCPRLEQQRPCSFLHPEDFQRTSQVCFDWQRTGKCGRGIVCRWAHSHTNPAAAQPKENTAAASAAQQAADSIAPASSDSLAAACKPQESKEDSEAMEMDSEAESGAATAAAAAAAASAPASPPSSPVSSTTPAAAVTPSKKRGRPSKAEQALAAETATEEIAEQEAATAAATASSAVSNKKAASAPSSLSWNFNDIHDTATPEELEDCERRAQESKDSRKAAAAAQRAAAAPPSPVSASSACLPLVLEPTAQARQQQWNLLVVQREREETATVASAVAAAMPVTLLLPPLPPLLPQPASRDRLDPCHPLPTALLTGDCKGRRTDTNTKPVT